MKTTLVCLCALASIRAAALAEQPSTFGTTATSYISLGPGDLQPESTSTTFTRNYQLTASSGNFWAYPDLPSGALLTSIALDFCDDDGGMSPYFGVGFLDRTGNEMGAGVYLPQSIGPGCTSLTLTTFSVPFTQKNAENRMAILVTPSSTVKINGLVIGYQLQVSPAPATATFNDVPTSDFAFQYIEALAASGITGGCGGGNYCPDTFVTRRQMAIFISKALGLQWQ